MSQLKPLKTRLTKPQRLRRLRRIAWREKIAPMKALESCGKD